MKFKILILLFIALCLLRQEWHPHYLSPFNWRDGKTTWTLMYVIGDSTGKELFCIPNPNIKMKWMTPEEAENANKELNYD